MVNVTKIAEQSMKYRNVVGYSMKPQARLRAGNLCENDVIRIYVSKKLPLNELRTKDILPKELDGYAVDVVEIGEVYAIPPTICTTDRRQVVRPLVSGISVGNEAITAGTLGTLASYRDGSLYAMTNAHVGCDDPSHETSDYKRILQPGKYDGGDINNPDHIIGEYAWHERIYPISMESFCPVSNAAIKIMNTFASLHWRTRFTTYVAGKNYQDLCAIKLKDGLVFDTSKTFDFPLTDYALAARVFAGSDQVGIACKIKYQLEAGYQPIVRYTQDLTVGDVLRKSGRTSYDTTATITDTSAAVNVSYGNFSALVEDVIITTNTLCQGGDSGSDCWKKVA